MKTLLAALAAVCVTALAPVAPTRSAEPTVCTILGHPVGCVPPAPIWAHGSTGFGKPNH